MRKENNKTRISLLLFIRSVGSWQSLSYLYEETHLSFTFYISRHPELTHRLFKWFRIFIFITQNLGGHPALVAQPHHCYLICISDPSVGSECHSPFYGLSASFCSTLNGTDGQHARDMAGVLQKRTAKNPKIEAHMEKEFCRHTRDWIE